MITEFEYIKFRELPNPGKSTQVFDCLNKKSGTVIGMVLWYGAWRQYCFFPADQTVFSAGCLADTQKFIRQLMEERKDHPRFSDPVETGLLIGGSADGRRFELVDRELLRVPVLPKNVAREIRSDGLRNFDPSEIVEVNTEIYKRRIMGIKNEKGRTYFYFFTHPEDLTETQILKMLFQNYHEAQR